MKSKSAGFAIVGLGLLVAVVAMFVATKPVENTWGQNCGSVFAPESKPEYGGISEMMDEAAFSSACSGAMAPSAAWTWVLLVAALGLVPVGTFVAIRSAAAKSSALIETLPETPAPVRSVALDLEKLKVLHDSGALSDAEYAAAKDRVLSDQS